MKKLVQCILFSSFLLFGFSLGAKAQFEFGMDTVYVGLEQNTFKAVNVIIDNSKSSEDLEYEWSEVNRDLNLQWEVQFCDCRTCYADYHAMPNDTTITCTGFFNIPAGQDFSGFKLDVNPKTINDTGYLTVQFDQVNGNATGVVTFGARFFPTSAQELKNAVKQFEIYPNPASDLINFSIDIDRSIRSIRLRVVDLLGKEMRQEALPVGSTLFQMDASDLNTGIYFVQLTNLEGDVLKTKKLIKN